MKRKAEKVVNIIGMARSAKTAPFGQGERWGINCAYVYGKMDRSFWLHHPTLIPQSLRIDSDTMNITQVIKSFPDMEIYTLDPLNIEESGNQEGPELTFNSDIQNPNGKVLITTKGFPFQEFDDLFCVYSTSSLMYVIGLAVLEKFDRVRLYGVEIWSGISAGEYEFEREGIEHISMWAEGKGTHVEGIEQIIKARNAAKGVNNRYGRVY